VGPTARVQLAVVGRRESGAPHESAHVDVRLEAGELLELAPRGQACRSITSTWLECVLDYDGRATFEALPRDGLTGTQRVVARSGPQIKELLLAVGNVPPAATVQRGDKSLVVARSRPLSCSSQATTGCSVRTSRRLALKPTGTVTSATATTVTLGSVGPPGSVWLSPTQGCDGDVQRLEVSFAAGATVSSPFYLCTNGARTSAALHAASGDAGPVELELWGVPESFAPTRLADGGQTLVARDCFSQPLGGIQVAFPDGALGVTDDAGTVGLVRGPSSADAGVAPVRVVVEQPEVLGSRSECTLEVLP